MAKFVEDSFTDTDGTTLQSHTGEVGASWTRHASVGVDAYIQSNRFKYSPGNVYALYYASGLPASADYWAVCDHVDVSPTTHETGPCVRVQTGAHTLYEAYYDNAAFPKRWRMRKRVAGTTTELGTYNTDTSGTSVKLEAIGTSIKLYLGGIERISATDSDITVAGRAGVRTEHGTQFVGYGLDNFYAEEAVVAGGRQRRPLITPAALPLAFLNQ